MRHYHEELRELQTQTAMKNRLETILNELREQKSTLESRVEELSEQKEKEQLDVERLQAALRWFKTELSDVEIIADMQVNIDGFLRFADYFFDGLFADWSVMNQISDTQGQVEKVRIKQYIPRK